MVAGIDTQLETGLPLLKIVLVANNIAESPKKNLGAQNQNLGSFGLLETPRIYIYTAGPVYESFADQSWLVSEGHFIRFTKHLSETANHVLAYERNTKFQNLRYERITSIRLKSAKLKKKTYYHAFLRNILAFNLKNIISEHICKLFKPVPLIRTQTGVNIIQTNIKSSPVSSGLNWSHTCVCTVCGF